MPKLHHKPSLNRTRFGFSCWTSLWCILLVSPFFAVLQSVHAQTGRQSPADEGWVAAEVRTDQVLIHQTPNDASFITDSVRQGELLWIKNYSAQSEWYLVRPPEDAISWVLESDINEIRNGEARIRAKNTQIRPGRIGARLPGPPGLQLEQGEIVWLLNREPLVLPQNGGLVTWRAIEPPTQEPRFARKTLLKILTKQEEPDSDGFINAKSPGILADSTPAKTRLNNDLNQDSKVPEIAEPSPGLAARPAPLDDDGNKEPASPEMKSQPEKEKKANPQKGIESLAILEPPKSLLGVSDAPEKALPPDLGTTPSLQFEKPDSAEMNQAISPPMASPLQLPDDPELAMEVLESRFRVMMDQPLIAWDFKPIVNSCDSLQKRSLTGDQAARLNAIRDKAERQDQIGQSARQFWDSMRRSRAYDPTGIDRNQITQAANYSRFDISGLLLRSQKNIEGQFLFNLIGESGTTIAYLKLPPAAPVERWLGKKVGIKGRVRYHEDLRARIVYVQDIELLEPESD